MGRRSRKGQGGFGEKRPKVSLRLNSAVLIHWELLKNRVNIDPGGRGLQPQSVATEAKVQIPV